MNKTLLIHACLILLALNYSNSADWKTAKISAFSNNPYFEHITGQIYQELSQERLQEFLKQGKVIPEEEARSIDETAPISISEELAQSVAKYRKTSVEELKNELIALRLVKCNGAFASEDKIYFWELKNDWILKLQSPNGSVQWLYEKQGASGVRPPVRLVDPYSLQFNWRFAKIKNHIADLRIRDSKLNPAPSTEGLIHSISQARLINIEEFQNYQQELLRSLDEPKILEVNSTGALLTRDEEIYFWELWGQKVMKIWNNHNESIFIKF